MDFNRARLIAEVSPKRMQIFEAFASSLSYKDAAIEVGVSEPSVRQNVEALQRAVGGDLITARDGARGAYELTQLGRMVREAGVALLDSCEAITRMGRSGRPSVAFLPHHAPLLAEVCRDPQLRAAMELHVLGESERSVAAFQSRVLARLAAGAIDVAVGHPPRDAALRRTDLYAIEIQAMVSKDRPGSSISLRELAAHELVLPPERTRSRMLLDDRFRAARLTPRVALEAYQTKVLVLMGWAGLGTVVLPSDLARLYGEEQDFGGLKAHGFKWVTVLDRHERPLTHQVAVTTQRSRSGEVRAVVSALDAAARRLGYADA